MQNTKKIRILSNVEIAEDSYLARTLNPNQTDEIEEFLAFRHSIFREELGWSSDDASEYDIDAYDRNAIHFGVFSDSGDLVGYCRLILPESGFMIEKEFSALVDPEYEIRKDKDTVEISRFAIPKNLRGVDDGFKIIALLLRCVYKWAITNEISYIYGVCATDHLKFVTGLVSCCKPIGPSFEYQPGISSSALIMDLDNLDLTEAKTLWSIATS